MAAAPARDCPGRPPVISLFRSGALTGDAALGGGGAGSAGLWQWWRTAVQRKRELAAGSAHARRRGGRRGGGRGGASRGGRGGGAAAEPNDTREPGKMMSEKAVSSGEKLCARCGEPSKLRCTRCKEVHYCGKTCQREHWKEHKSDCRNTKAAAKKAFKEAAKRQRAFGEEPAAEKDEEVALLPPPPPGTVLHSYSTFRALWRHHENGSAEDGGGGADDDEGESQIGVSGEREATDGSRASGENGASAAAREASATSAGVAGTSGSGGTSSGRAAKARALRCGDREYDDEEIEPGAVRAFPVGLRNVGNTCFANSVLQCLAQASPMVRAIQAHGRGVCTRPGRWCVLCELAEFFDSYEEAQEGRCVTPRSLLGKIKKMGRHLTFGAQEDSHDFLLQLLDSMQMRVLADYGGERHVPHSVQETTNVWHAFGGRTRGQVECRECGHVSSTFQGYLTLELQIPAGVDSLEAALEAFTESDTLSGDNAYRCDECKVRVEAEQSTRLEEGPNFLQVALKRFSISPFARFGGGKISRKVSFGPTLDLAPFMATDSRDRPPQYLLYGIIVHISPFSAGGHYVAFVKAGDGKWYECDDSNVTEVDEEEALSQTAYMLFYRRARPRNWGVPGEAPATEPTKGRAPSVAEAPSGATFDEPRHIASVESSAEVPYGAQASEALEHADRPGAHVNEEGGLGGSGDGDSPSASRSTGSSINVSDARVPKYTRGLREGPAPDNTLCLMVELPGVQGAKEVEVKTGGTSIPIEILAAGYRLELGAPYNVFRLTKSAFIKKLQSLRLEFQVPRTYRPPGLALKSLAPTGSSKKSKKKKGKK